MSALAPTLEAFFTERLIGQRNASPNTVAAYRDTWRLVLRFARARTGKEPSRLDLGDLDAPSSARSWTTWSKNGTTPRGPATPAFPRSARSSATRRCVTPSTQR